MLPTTMAASVLVAPGVLEVERREVPSPRVGEVLVQVSAVGVCGSDAHYFRHGRIGDYVVDAPLVLGHEASGRIVAVGAGVGLPGSESGCRSSRNSPTPTVSRAAAANTTSVRTCGSMPPHRSTVRSPSTSRSVPPSRTRSRTRLVMRRRRCSNLCRWRSPPCVRLLSGWVVGCSSPAPDPSACSVPRSLRPPASPRRS